MTMSKKEILEHIKKFIIKFKEGKTTWVGSKKITTEDKLKQALIDARLGVTIEDIDELFEEIKKENINELKKECDL